MGMTLPRRPGPLALTLSAAALLSATAVSARNWSDWSAPASIETLPGSSTLVNTAGVDGCASLSPDGLELLITSNRPGGFGGVDIWIARRESISQGFGDPQNAGPAVNGPFDDYCPTLTRGGRLFYGSRRDDPAGDLYVIRRGPKGWGELERLGPNINTNGAIEESPSLYSDEDGHAVLYFSSTRSGPSRIYYSIDFGPALLAPGGVNSSADDARPTVRKDGLEIFWDSTRAGSLGGFDFWTATRSSTSEPWDTAVHLASLSSAGPGGFFQPGFDARPSISWDGSTMVFASVRTGGEGAVDLYTASREQVTGRK
jgi:WD40-like Beta Propeller Repeat